MLISQAHSFTQQARLAITLAWVAGCTNIVTLLACGTVTSHVTGTASALAHELTRGHLAAAGYALYLLILFFFGAAASGALVEIGRRRGWDSIYVLPMAAQACLLAGLAVGLELHDPAARIAGVALWWLTGTASMAMGLQNATITRISAGVVRTTHLTGVLTDLGTEAVHLLFGLRDRQPNLHTHSTPTTANPTSPRAPLRTALAHPAARRLALLASILGSFMVGAAVGALSFAHLPRWSMVGPVAFLLWIIWIDLRVPICEVEPLGSGADRQTDLAGHLPDGLAVYHLRRTADRAEAAHRLPDLLRWCERLPPPPTARVLILDLSEATTLDANAALELRALVRQARAKGRRIILAGMTREQFKDLQASDAGDTLDPDTICPDLELAIARGLVLLEDEPSA